MPKIDDATCACAEAFCTWHLHDDRCGKPLLKEARAALRLARQGQGGFEKFGLCDECWNAVNKHRGQTSEAGM
jgi:hypothetical protein